MAGATFSAPGGQDPAQHFRKVMLAVETTVGDAIEAGSILVARIRERTAQGIDANGMAFPEYSAGYAKQKIARIGSASPVDLFGFQNHPHMLNTILIKAGGAEFPPGAVGEGVEAVYPGRQIEHFEAGFYGDEAVRARVHNEGGSVRTRLGTGKSGRKPKPGGKASFEMPVRHFWDANAEDIRLMEFAIGERAEARAKRV